MSSSSNIIVADTSVFLHDPEAVDILRQDGNTLVVPMCVIDELERLKSKPDIGMDAAVAIDKLEAVSKHPSLRIVSRIDYSGLDNLNRNDPYHQIIAVTRQMYNQRAQLSINGKVKLVSRSSALRLMARELCNESVIVEDWRRDQVGPLSSTELKEIELSHEDILPGGMTFNYDEKKNGHIMLNEGVVVLSDYDPQHGRVEKTGRYFAALRKGRLFYIIPPDINLMGLTPKSVNGEGRNWTQEVAMAQLLDPTIPLVFMEGVAGTGKTLLAIAAALEQRHEFQKIVISRPMIHLEDVDRMGFLPGDEQEKMSPWLRPIQQAFDFLYTVDHKENKKIISELDKNNRIIREPLDYIRGTTYHHAFVIVDEAQNTTPHMIKTIITRAGLKTKLVFTGDLAQIDRFRVINRSSSGLAYAIKKTLGHRIVGFTHFHETVRSPLASLGQELL